MVYKNENKDYYVDTFSIKEDNAGVGFSVVVYQYIKTGKGDMAGKTVSDRYVFMLDHRNKSWVYCKTDSMQNRYSVSYDDFSGYVKDYCIKAMGKENQWK